MKNLITLSMLLFCCTVFASQNSQPRRTENENAHIVSNPHCCMNYYCIACTLCCLYFYIPRSTCTNCCVADITLPTGSTALPNRKVKQSARSTGMN